MAIGLARTVDCPWWLAIDHSTDLHPGQTPAIGVDSRWPIAYHGSTCKRL